MSEPITTSWHAKPGRSVSMVLYLDAFERGLRAEIHRILADDNGMTLREFLAAKKEKQS